MHEKTRSVHLRKTSPKYPALSLRACGLVAVLMIAPGLSVFSHWSATGSVWLLVGLFVVSLVAYWLHSTDKSRAREASWRVSEATLHGCELLGGWPGAFIAQRRLRHKVSKLSYQGVFWLIVGLHQFVAIDYLLDWEMTHSAYAFVDNQLEN